MAKYGMPYMGSKSGIAEKIINILPKAPVLYDLFGGGGAITHCAALSGKWRKIVYNDINKVIVDGFRTAINGGFKDEKRWIGRKDFFRLTKYDPYVNMCFSFGNKGNSYAYSKEIEPLKKAMHYALFFHNWEPLKKLTGIDLSRECADLPNIMDRYFLLKKHIKESENRLQSLEWFVRLQQLDNLTRLVRLQTYNEDYSKVPLTEKGIIYCDIPYENTVEYSQAGSFDHDKFYKWVAEQDLPVYVSSYEINRPHFRCIASIKKRNTLSASANKLVYERVYRYIK